MGFRQNDRKADQSEEDDAPDREGVARCRNKRFGIVIEAAIVSRPKIHNRYCDERDDREEAVEGRKFWRHASTTVEC